MNTHWLVKRAKDMPDKTAFIFNDEIYTFQMVYEHAHQLARHIRALDSRRVALFVQNNAASYFLINACMLANVEIVLINNRLQASEIEWQLNDIGVDVVITTRSLSLGDIRVIEYERLEDMDSSSFVGDTFEPTDTLSVMFTSGTTGRAKAVIQTYANHMASEVQCRTALLYDDSSTWLCVNPIYHISGLSIIFRTLITGSTLVMSETFDEDKVLALIDAHNVTHTSFVPVMLERLIHKDFDWSNVSVLLGGANVRVRLLKAAIDRNIKVYNSYGMTETMSQMITISYYDSKMLEGAVGRIDGGYIKLDDDGHIWVGSDNVTPGYLNADIVKRDGFFNTGDIGHIDGKGYLYILDRREDLIISGGENIYPKEIEDLIHAHLDIHVVVVKRTSDTWGEVPVLVIEGAYNEELVASIKALFDKNLARFKHPKDIIFVEEILRTSTGKVSRRLNKGEYVDTKKEKL